MGSSLSRARSEYEPPRTHTQALIRAGTGQSADWISSASSATQSTVNSYFDQQASGIWSSPTKLTSAPDFQQRLTTFKAMAPQYQEWCVAAMNGTQPGNADAGRDVFIWRLLYARGLLSRGSSPFYRGFYVESGANHWKDHSNTFFYDKCLGWEGLCVEPNPQYHAGLRKHRSCVLVPECLSETPNATLTMGLNGMASSVKDTRRKPIKFKYNKMAPLLTHWAKKAAETHGSVVGHRPAQDYAKPAMVPARIHTVLLSWSKVPRGACPVLCLC